MECFIIDVSELDDASLYDRCRSILSDERKAKVNSYVFKKDRFLSIAAGLFIEYIKRRYDTEIIYGENDKPLSSNGSVEFNVSHSGHFLVGAISDMPIGVDIEMIADNEELVDTVMTDNEKENYLRSPNDQKDVLFCRMWTAKESYMKAIGSGLTLSPKAFSVIGPNGIDRLPDGYNLYEPKAPEGYRVSICSKEDSYSELKKISCSELREMIIRQ